MNQQQTITSRPIGEGSLVYYRLIALWVLSEAMLGGIIHGLKIPVSGLVVGGCAVICISLIAWYVPAKGSIFKATVIVAVFKMMLSPQAPFPAYIAVLFQGVLGELLFWNRRFYKVSCMLFALLALLESGFQRIIMLTVIYGTAFWKAINDFINGLTGQAVTTNYSLLIGGGYVFLHLIAGIMIGRWASILPERINNWSKNQHNSRWLRGWEREGGDAENVLMPERTKKKRFVERGMFVVWIVLILLYVQSYFNIGKPLLPSHISLKILIRSVIIVLGWYFIFNPLLKKLLHYWLQRKKTASRAEIQKVLELLPATQELAAQSWRASAGRKGWKRLIVTGKIILVNALEPANKRQVFILTGPIQTGKTTSLINWSEKRKDAWGILTPVVNDKRVFMNVRTKEQFAMEAAEGETEILIVGRFTFSKAAFDKAIGIIRDGMNKNGWLIIDEIGPMELRDEGFAMILREVLTDHKGKMLLVVREGFEKKVKDHFRINNIMLTRNISNISNEI
ncbi:MAG: nucleoside-triphosphatase [Chitinophagaceae bacterium]